MDGHANAPEGTRPDDDLRIGIVGAGGVGERHARVLSSLPGVAVAGIADVDGERAAGLAAAVGADAFRGAGPLVDAGIDALYVCTPPFARGDAERLAAERGLPLFVEKPLAADLPTAEAVAAEVAAAGIPTATGYHWRHLDIVEEARQLLAGRRPGLVAGRWFDKVPPPAWWARRDGSGGQVVEQATHLVDMARYLVGEVESVAALGTSCGTTGPDGDVDEASVAILGFRNGAVGTMSATCLFHRKHATTLDVVAPGMAVEVSESELVVRDEEGERRRAPGNDPRVEVDREFVDVVRGNLPAARAPYADALVSHRVACAMAESATSGAPVVLAG
jgi:myo-inositol 2-dehydrogenase / D-chiro-inositol 1-dehydrogenase